MEAGLEKEGIELMRGSFFSGVNDAWLVGGPNMKGSLPAIRALLKAHRVQQLKETAAVEAKKQLAEDLEKLQSAANKPDQERQVIRSTVKTIFAEMDDPSEILERAWQTVHDMLSQFKANQDAEAGCS